MEPDASVLRPDRGPDKQNNHIWHWESGDEAATDAALAAAEVRVAEDIYIPRIHVASIETCGCVADWDAVRGQLTLHMTTPGAARHPDRARPRQPGLPRAEHPGQDPRHRRRLRRQGAGLPGLRPRGRRLVLTVGKPVKWIEDRSENLQADSFARDYHIHAELGATKDGKITGAQGQDHRRPRLHRRRGRPVEVPGRPVQRHHRLATTSTNAFVEVDGVYTNKPPGGVAYRCSFRVTEAVHAIERMVDILAHEIGKDPAQLRMENFIQPEQFPYKTPTGWEYDSGNYPARAPEGAWT